MLVITAVSFGFASVGALLVAGAVRVAVRRLGLDMWDVAVWFGLADAPADELATKRAAPLRVLRA